MKRIYFGLLVLFICISQTACKEEDEIKIGFLMESINSARWVQDKTHFENRINKLGGKVLFKESNGDESLQFKQATELINSGINVLVIIPANVNSAASIVREAHKNKVKVISYDRLIKNAELDYFVGFDSYQIGRLQAEYAVKNIPKGNFVIIGGDRTDITAVQTKNGQMDILNPLIESGDIKILYSVYINDWSPQNAKFKFSRAYNLCCENVDVILSANDGMVAGITEYIEENKIKMPIITGLDADLEACKRIIKDKQSMTIYTPISKLATTAAELAIKIANGKKFDYNFKYQDNGRTSVPSIILDAIIVDKNNIESTIIKDGIYTKEEIGIIEAID